ncbi:hypothetical protein P7C73_g1444, partial [Tremellales sp. Uapishka_1]
MPSMFQRNRRSVDLSNSPMPDSPTRTKRMSMDNGNELSTPPPSGKFKAFFHPNASVVGEEKSSMRKRLSSPSTFFQKHDDSTVKPATEHRDSHAVLARYTTPTPRSPIQQTNTFPSPTLFPDEFSLAQTSIAPTANGTSKRASQSWTPSYPMIIPDNSYADIPPDGLASPTTPSSPVKVDENSHRRSLDLGTSGLLLKPNVFSSLQTQLPTPPPSASPVEKPEPILSSQAEIESDAENRSKRRSMSRSRAGVVEEIPTRGSSLVDQEQENTALTLGNQEPSTGLAKPLEPERPAGEPLKMVGETKESTQEAVRGRRIEALATPSNPTPAS